MSAHGSTPVNRDEFGELPLLTLSGHSLHTVIGAIGPSHRNRF
jgi:hypothetical protein